MIDNIIPKYFLSSAHCAWAWKIPIPFPGNEIMHSNVEYTYNKNCLMYFACGYRAAEGGEHHVCSI